MNNMGETNRAHGSTQSSQNSPAPLVSVVLLSYARPKYLAEALASVMLQSYSNLEVIVVDNQSESSDDIAAIAKSYPKVRLIANSRNLGFTGGMNQGIHVSRGEYILLTEDDEVLDSNCVAEFMAYVQREDRSPRHLLSGLILNKSNGAVWSAGANVQLGVRFRMTVFGCGEVDSGQFAEPFDVNYLSGSMIFVPASLLKDLGGFREDFFMYYEDVDLCFRALDRNCRLTIVPSARLSHFQPAMSEEPERLSLLKAKNLMTLYILHARAHVVFAFLIRHTTWLALKGRRNDVVLWLRAFFANVTRLPMLWRDRRRMNPDRRQRDPKRSETRPVVVRDFETQN
jgi:GT2 family glycosyltransferase